MTKGGVERAINKKSEEGVTVQQLYKNFWADSGSLVLFYEGHYGY